MTLCTSFINAHFISLLAVAFCRQSNLPQVTGLYFGRYLYSLPQIGQLAFNHMIGTFPIIYPLLFVASLNLQ